MLEKEEIKELIEEIKRGVEDTAIGSISRIDFKDYASHKADIENELQQLNLFDKIEIEYNFMGISIKYKRA